MELIDRLTSIHGPNPPRFMICGDRAIGFDAVVEAGDVNLDSVVSGDVVAVIGDYSPVALNTLLRLFDLPAIVVPLSPETVRQHEYFFETAGVDVVIDLAGDGVPRRVRPEPFIHSYYDYLRAEKAPGLILFSSGTTGRPKAIVHDFRKFLARFGTPRPALKTLNFLLFDHIGGINTLLHTLFNRGLVVVPSGRTPEAVIADIERHAIELLPTTPTFLRMLLLSGLVEDGSERLQSLRVITYGTEPMDQETLNHLCRLLPKVDFRQTYGMSELGILRVKSRSRDSLWMAVGGEGVMTRIDENGVLKIFSETRMLGYLNAPSPFDDGWYDTGDIVQEEDGHIKIIGRSKQIINVGGIKILPTEIERVALLHAQVIRCRAEGKPNPVTGQHIEVTCEAANGAPLTRQDLRKHFALHLPETVQPHKIVLGPVAYSHRFKRE